VRRNKSLIVATQPAHNNFLPSIHDSTRRKYFCILQDGVPSSEPKKVKDPIQFFMILLHAGWPEKKVNKLPMPSNSPEGTVGPLLQELIRLMNSSCSSVEQEYDMIVNLAAGLDARAYRMQLPKTLKWVDVDLPA
jgi:hypothetical protein